MKRTPGPWEIKNNTTSTQQYFVCNPAHSQWPIACEMNVEDAKLVAAAPDMLAMLEELEWADMNNDLCPVCDRYPNEGHYPDCKLGNLINESKES